MSENIDENFVIEAEYIKPVNPRERGNPLIEALPEQLDRKSLIKYHCNIPVITSEMRQLSRPTRAALVDIIKELRLPLDGLEMSSHLIDQMIKESYVNINPFSYCNPVYSNLKDLNGKITSQNYKDRISGIMSQSSGRLILGTSGVGKTTTISSILSRYPPVIRHTEYEGEPFTKTQIVYLYIDVPFNADPETFCKLILRAIDERIGINIYEPTFERLYACGDIGFMIVKIGELIKKYSIALIVIDEVQSLLNEGTRESRLLTELLLNINNNWQCSLLFVGTMKAHLLLDHNLRSTRRFVMEGSYYWDLMEKDNTFWNDIINILWDLQLTVKRTELTEEIRDVLYKYSQGNLAILLSLFRMVQKRIILEGTDPNETITPEIIEKVAHKDFLPFQNFLKALESKDITKIIEYEDIIPDLENIDLIQLKSSESCNIKTLTSLQIEAIRENRKETETQLINILYAFGGFSYLKRKDLKEIAKKVLKEAGDNPELDELKLEAMTLAIELENSRKAQAQEQKKIEKEEKRVRERTKNNQLLESMDECSNEEELYDLLKERHLVEADLEGEL